MPRQLARIVLLIFSAGLLSACPDDSQVDWVNRADLLDQYVISALREGTESSVIPNNASEQDIANRIDSFEQLLDAALEKAWGADDRDEASLLRLVGLETGVNLRRLYSNESLKTRIMSLQGRSGCETDLTLGRHFARYGRAMADKDNAEQLLVMAEWQNGLSCLSARQAAALADVLGAVIMALEVRVNEFEIPADQLDRAFATLLQPVLLAVDTTKGLIPSAAHFWARGRAAEFAPILNGEDTPFYLYDFMSGNLASLRDTALLGEHLDELLDRGNIGLGTCGFLEMLGSGLDSGRFDCSRGVGCGQNPLNLNNPLDPDLSPELPSANNLADVLARGSRTGFADLDFSLFGADPVGSSALGVPMADLSDNCGGAGASGEGSEAGGLGNDMGFMGCMFRGAVANARKGDAAYCTLAAMHGAAGQAGSTIVVGGVDPVTGAPVIRGIFGNEECETDPLAGNGENGRKPISSLDEFKSAVRRAAIMTAAGMTAGSTALENDYLEGVGHGMIDRWGAGGPGGTSHTSTNQDTLNRMKQWVTDDVNKAWPWEDGDKSVIKGRVADGIASAEDGELPEDIFGTYNHQTGEITVDMSKAPGFINVVLTILDEVAHAIESGIRDGTGSTRFRPSEDQLHKANYATLCSLSGSDCQWLMDAIKAQIEANEEEDTETGPNTDGTDTQLPEGPQGPEGGTDSCSALADTMREVMACHGFDEVGPGITGPSGPGDPPEPMGPDGFMNVLLDLPPDDGGDVDPSEEQWIASMGSGLFGQCMAEHGLGVVAVDRNGVYVIGPAQGLEPDRCSEQILCPASGEAILIGATCRCSAPSGALLRDLGVMRLCQTSDACFPDPRLLEIRDVREQLPEPEVP